MTEFDRLKAMKDRLVAQQRDAWKQAVIEALMVAEIYQAAHEHDPRRAVNDLLRWQQDITKATQGPGPPGA